MYPTLLFLNLKTHSSSACHYFIFKWQKKKSTHSVFKVVSGDFCFIFNYKMCYYLLHIYISWYIEITVGEINNWIIWQIKFYNFYIEIREIRMWQHCMHTKYTIIHFRVTGSIHEEENYWFYRLQPKFLVMATAHFY